MLPAISPARYFILASLLACACVLLIGMVSLRAALVGWLSAFLLLSSLPMGGLLLVAMMRMIPGRWRAELSVAGETALLLLPVALIALLPIIAGIDLIYSWETATQLAGFKGIYLKPIFFALRSLLILGGFCALGFLLIRHPASRAIAIGSIIFVVLLHNLLAVDWVMSLDTAFHSSSFGLYFLCLQTLAALAVLVIISLLFPQSPPPAVSGGLLLTGLLLWAYFSFTQYVVIWSDNLPGQVIWYKDRSEGLWQGAVLSMAALRLVPALLLFFAPVRRSRAWLLCLSGCVVAGSIIEMAWLVMPTLKGDLRLSIFAYAMSAIAIGALSAAVFVSRSRFLAYLPSRSGKVSA